MPFTTSTSASLPTQTIHEPNVGRFLVVVDTLPATLDDVSVAVGSRTVRVEVGGSIGCVHEVEPPSPKMIFGDERRAWYHNGVLTVAVETVHCGRALE
ncbi:hypothetical protein [Natronosalvus vescus]|uniref:hypothetical protein n=1 Tax=Natronosalvus vescus TaxID=2953881 RepID=UPI002090335B|nr:hypothetical protein [Natronosalvus vescus]